MTCDMKLMDGEEIQLDEYEVNLLAFGPKFCVMSK